MQSHAACALYPSTAEIPLYLSPCPPFTSASSPLSILLQTSITRAFYLLHSSVEVTRPQGIIANIFSQVRPPLFPLPSFVAADIVRNKHTSSFSSLCYVGAPPKL